MYIFDCTSIIGYDNYKNFISSLKENFDIQKARLFNEYNIKDISSISSQSSYFEFRTKYRSLRQDIIKTVIKKFRYLLPKECLIYEFGSLTKFTDRIESDTDLTICYDSPKTELFECVEELINYSITYVFEHSIDHIHGKFQHYPMMHEFDSLKESDNLYILKFDKTSIEIKCGPETLSENLMNIKNVRDYISLIKGYEEKYLYNCNIDCLYSIQILENTTNHDFLEDLADLERDNNIFTQYSYAPEKYIFDQNLEISYIKKAFKNTVVSLYIMVAYLRKKVKWLNSYSMTIEDVFNSEALRAFFGEAYITRLKASFITMFFYWDKIELLLKKNNILLSTRCHKIFSKQQLNDMLFHEYHLENMMDDILLAINTLNDVVTEGWSSINQKL